MKLARTLCLLAATFAVAALIGCDEQAPAVAQDQCVNARCPMMGNDIDPANVPAHLTRMHKGKKVGFCCGGCPAAWDALSDAEKEAKLTKAGCSQPKACEPGCGGKDNCETCAAKAKAACEAAKPSCAAPTGSNCDEADKDTDRNAPKPSGCCGTCGGR